MDIRRLTIWLLLTFAGVAVAAQEVEQRKIQKINLERKVREPVNTKFSPPEHFTPAAQKLAARERYTRAVILDGDTVPFYMLREVTVYASGMLLTPKEIRKNAKLIRNVRLMLPFAREAKRRLDVLEVEIANLPKKERKAAIKRAEQQIKDDYQDRLKKFTFSQGLVLIKLIDRETNRTAYSLVGDLRGSFRAGVYQAFARLFGYNLKTKFDPQHDKKDELIDRIVRSIERGQL